MRNIFGVFNLRDTTVSPFMLPTASFRAVAFPTLSSLLLVGAWQEFLCQQLPQVIPRSYADDLSITTSHHEPCQMREDVIQAHQHTRRFADLTGGQISCDKSFSFGHESLKGNIPSLPNHEQHFRLTGGTRKRPAGLSLSSPEPPSGTAQSTRFATFL